MNQSKKLVLVRILVGLHLLSINDKKTETIKQTISIFYTIKPTFVYLPSILLDRSTLRSHGGTPHHFDMDNALHIVDRVYPADRDLHSCEEEATGPVSLTNSL